MRLGILGGTFDPIHFGHLLAAEEARGALRLEGVLFAPAGDPPHKQGYAILPVAHRLAMVRLAIADNPAFQISTVDIDRTGPHYTVDTLRLLRNQLGIGSDETFLIMGADSLTHLTTWHQPAQLIEICRLAVVARPGYRADLEALEAALPGISTRLDWVEMPVLGISSSDLQRRVREGRSIRYQVPSAVAAYVAKHALYRDDRS
ncbi:MAG: nicotinate-nucleotide adenylyltransferase [Anaerolineales bacterium]|nr:MAG: nicotinate-nucleotide adenylyltransferase [Anaerolineales bacterium]